MLRIINFFKQQSINYQLYIVQFRDSTAKMQKKTYIFIASIFFLYFVMNAYYSFYDHSQLTTQNFIEIAYSGYFLIAYFVMYHFNTHAKQYIIPFAYFNIIILTLYLLITQTNVQYNISFTLMVIVIFIPALTIYSRFSTYGLLLAVLLLIDYLIVSNLQHNITHSFYYIFESAIIWAIASFIHITVFSAKLNEILQIKVIENERDHDDLTGLLKRKAMEIYIKEFEGSSNQHGMLVLDLDRFKQVNDQFGHAEGDSILVNVARVLQASLQDDDRAARYGGDEFIVFLPNTSKDEVDQKINLIETQLNSIEDDRISFSIGMSIQLGTQNNLFNRLFVDADKKMYINKSKTH